MKKLLILTSLVTSNILMPAGASEITYNQPLGTIFIHNQGNKPFILNYIKCSFTGAPQKTYKLTYEHQNIKNGMIGQIRDASIQFPASINSHIFYLGISEIGINNNQKITFKKPNPSNYDIYVTNQGNIWKETTQPKVLTPKAKNVTAKIAPEISKNTVPEAKTSTVKAATVVVKNKAKMPQPQSKAAKAINTATLPKPAIIKPETIK
jgi:hypothetical protein